MILTPITISLWAFLFATILTSPGEVFSWWPSLVRKITTGTTKLKDTEELNAFQFAIQKVTFACAKCGAFWWWTLYFNLFETGTKDFILGGIICVFTAFIIEQVWTNLQIRGIV